MSGRYFIQEVRRVNLLRHKNLNAIIQKLAESDLELNR
jgi:hypothetical protein